MRLTCWLFGHEVLAIDLGAAPEDDPAAALDGGTLGSIGPVGFVVPVGNVEDVPMPQRTPAWDDDE